MEIRPDLSICLLPEQEGADLVPCLEALAACADPLSLELFIPQGAECGDFCDSPHLHALAVQQASVSSFVEEVWGRSQGRYLALWNSAVIPSPAALITLVEFLDDHPDVAVAGPRFFNDRGDILTTAFACRKLLPWADPVVPGWDGLATMEADWVSGAALVLNRLALEDITMPGASMGGIWERRLCQRVQRRGWHVFFVHLSRVVSPEKFCEPTTLWHRLRDDWRQMMSFISDR